MMSGRAIKNAMRLIRLDRSWKRKKISKRLRAEVLFAKGIYCQCGTRWEALDHILPVSRGGLTAFENLVPICNSCNSKKGAT